LGVLQKITKQLRWAPARYWFYLREGMGSRVMVRDPVDGETYSFLADSLISFQRGKEFLSKEPKTIEWLRKNVRPNDVMLDIGANVGTFSIFAAKHMSAEGRVYACEPHLPTAAQLLQNVAANGVNDRVSVISVAASNTDGFFPFKYKRWRQGASGSQLAVEGGIDLTKNVGTELKSAMRIDSMVEKGLIKCPNLVKIDTDGLEIPIVEGMKGILAGPNRPRSMLVEIQPGELEAQTKLMTACGYRLAEKHQLTADGQGAFNAVFEPA
jgi:FkbM family methyltransferase